MRLAAVLLVLLVGALPAPAVHAQSRSDAERRAEAQARRDRLEAEVLRRFVERLERELDLTPEQRTRTEQALRANAELRSQLTRASTQLRGRMYRSLRSRDTNDAQFMDLLAQYEALRVREHQLWTRQQEELASFLTPRQRVEFIVTWARFQDTIREIMYERHDRDRDDRDRNNDDHRNRDEADARDRGDHDGGDDEHSGHWNRPDPQSVATSL